MEFQIVAGGTAAVSVADDVAGFAREVRRGASASVSWYRPLAPDDSVHIAQSALGLLLYLGEAVPFEVIQAIATELSAAGQAQDGAAERLMAACRTLTGVFSLAAVDLDSARVLVVSDPLSVRPWYWSSGGPGSLAVTTTRRAMRELLRPEPDLLGVTQLSIAGFCLGARSPMRAVQRNLPGEVLEFTPSRGVRTIVRKAPAELSDVPIEERGEELRTRFAAAVQSRLDRDHWDTAFLSGGLDSRMVVASLVERDRPPTAYTLTHGRSLDVQLAQLFASQAHLTLHHVSFHPARRILWAGRLRRALELVGEGERFTPTGWAWSGDGGSVCAGGVNVSEDLTAALTTYNESDPAPLLNRLSLMVPKALMSRAEFSEMHEQLAEDLSKELARLTRERGRITSYDFLVANDQRQHLDLHFEQWRHHRINYHLPFYDSRVTDWLRSAPESMIARHALYTEWLNLMPSFVRASAWQTYPGHIPCPLPMPEDLEYQFGARAAARFDRQVDVEFRQNLSNWIRRGLPGWRGISRPKSVVVSLLHASGVRKSDLSATILNDLVDPDGIGGLEIDADLHAVTH